MQTPTNDTEYLVAYIRLLIEKLEECQFSSPDQLEFSPQDKQVIEYHLKDVARESVSQELSTDDCVGIFCARISRLTKGEKEAWNNAYQTIRDNVKILKDADIVHMHKLSNFFNESEKVDSCPRASRRR